MRLRKKKIQLNQGKVMEKKNKQEETYRNKKEKERIKLDSATKEEVNE